MLRQDHLVDLQVGEDPVKRNCRGLPHNVQVGLQNEVLLLGPVRYHPVGGVRRCAAEKGLALVSGANKALVLLLVADFSWC